MSDDWVALQDERTGAGLTSPPGWERIGAGLAVIALAEPAGTVPDGAFRSNVVLTVEDVPVIGHDLATYSDFVVGGLLRAIPGLHIASVDMVELAGGLLGRRLVACYREELAPVVLQQWWTVRGGVATAVSASASVSAYAWALAFFPFCLRDLRPAVRALPAGTP